jgi:hypothetical protein
MLSHYILIAGPAMLPRELLGKSGWLGLIHTILGKGAIGHMQDVKHGMDKLRE